MRDESARFDAAFNAPDDLPVIIREWTEASGVREVVHQESQKAVPAAVVPL
jgi:hypothetical protein